MEKEKYLSLFVDESKENLQALNHYLLELEKYPSNQSLLNDIFRVAHTLKGMSSAMGFKDISSLTHEMESLLELLKEQKLIINTEIIDVLFLCLDNLEVLTENITNPTPYPVDSTNLMYRLKKLVRIAHGLSDIDLINIQSKEDKRDQQDIAIFNDYNQDKVITYNREEKDLLISALNQNQKCFQIYVEFVDNTVMKSVRAYMIINALQNSSIKTVKTSPSNIEIINNQIQNFLILCVITNEESDYLQNLVSGVSEIKYIEIIKLDENYFNESKLIDNNSISSESIDLNDYEKSLIQTAHQSGKQVLLIGISLIPGTLMKYVRYVMVSRKLQEIGEIIKTIPHSKTIENDNFNDYFEIILSTNSDNKNIISLLLSIGEINTNIKISHLVIDSYNNLNFEPVIDINENFFQDSYNNKLIKDEKIINNREKVRTSYLYDDKSLELLEPNLKYKNKQKPSNSTIRVDIEKLDKILELIKELGTINNKITDIKNKINSDTLNSALADLSDISLKLQLTSKDLKIITIDQLFSRLPRMMRDLSKQLNKEINFIIEENHIEIDKTFIDQVSESLIHILRNSADHGIEHPDKRRLLNKPEIGTIKLSAYYEENSLVITVEDDGAGMNIDKIKSKAIEKGLISTIDADNLSDEEAINMIFLSGFSTSDSPTDISGRGFGMDAVLKGIKSIGGNILIKTQKDIGSKFIIEIPQKSKD